MSIASEKARRLHFRLKQLKGPLNTEVPDGICIKGSKSSVCWFCTLDLQQNTTEKSAKCPFPWTLPYNRKGPLHRSDSTIESYTFGAFCSFPCMVSFAKKPNEFDSRFDFFELLFSQYFYSQHNVKPLTKLPEAPSKYCLERYGGTVTVDAYRESLEELFKNFLSNATHKNFTTELVLPIFEFKEVAAGCIVDKQRKDDTVQPLITHIARKERVAKTKPTRGKRPQQTNLFQFFN